MADDDQPPLILVDDRQSMPLDVDGLIALARECLVGEGVADSELSVSFVTEEEMADLHLRYMDEEGPTDVLSFPQDDDGDQEAEAPRRRRDRARRRRPQQPRTTSLPSSGCCSCTGSCTCSGTTTTTRSSAPRCGPGRSDTPGWTPDGLALGPRRLPRDPRLDPGDRRGLAHAHDAGARAGARRGGPAQRRRARTHRGRAAPVPERDLPHSDAVPERLGDHRGDHRRADLRRPRASRSSPSSSRSCTSCSSRR